MADRQISDSKETQNKQSNNKEKAKKKPHESKPGNIPSVANDENNIVASKNKSLQHVEQAKKAGVLTNTQAQAFEDLMKNLSAGALVMENIFTKPASLDSLNWLLKVGENIWAELKKAQKLAENDQQMGPPMKYLIYSIIANILKQYGVTAPVFQTMTEKPAPIFFEAVIQSTYSFLVFMKGKLGEVQQYAGQTIGYMVKSIPATAYDFTTRNSITLAMANESKNRIIEGVDNIGQGMYNAAAGVATGFYGVAALSPSTISQGVYRAMAGSAQTVSGSFSVAKGVGLGVSTPIVGGTADTAYLPYRASTETVSAVYEYLTQKGADLKNIEPRDYAKITINHFAKSLAKAGEEYHTQPDSKQATEQAEANQKPDSKPIPITLLKNLLWLEMTPPKIAEWNNKGGEKTGGLTFNLQNLGVQFFNEKKSLTSINQELKFDWLQNLSAITKVKVSDQELFSNLDLGPLNLTKGKIDTLSFDIDSEQGPRFNDFGMSLEGISLQAFPKLEIDKAVGNFDSKSGKVEIAGTLRYDEKYSGRLKFLRNANGEWTMEMGGFHLNIIDGLVSLEAKTIKLDPNQKEVTINQPQIGLRYDSEAKNKRLPDELQPLQEFLKTIIGTGSIEAVYTKEQIILNQDTFGNVTDSVVKYVRSISSGELTKETAKGVQGKSKESLKLKNIRKHLRGDFIAEVDFDENGDPERGKISGEYDLGSITLFDAGLVIPLPPALGIVHVGVGVKVVAGGEIAASELKLEREQTKQGDQKQDEVQLAITGHLNPQAYISAEMYGKAGVGIPFFANIGASLGLLGKLELGGTISPKGTVTYNRKTKKITINRISADWASTVAASLAIHGAIRATVMGLDFKLTSVDFAKWQLANKSTQYKGSFVLYSPDEKEKFMFLNREKSFFNGKTMNAIPENAETFYNGLNLNGPKKRDVEARDFYEDAKLIYNDSKEVSKDTESLSHVKYLVDKFRNIDKYRAAQRSKLDEINKATDKASKLKYYLGPVTFEQLVGGQYTDDRMKKVVRDLIQQHNERSEKFDSAYEKVKQLDLVSLILNGREKIPKKRVRFSTKRQALDELVKIIGSKQRGQLKQAIDSGDIMTMVQLILEEVIKKAQLGNINIEVKSSDAPSIIKKVVESGDLASITPLVIELARKNDSISPDEKDDLKSIAPLISKENNNK
ncbi:hypothetical protein BKI52_28800 [marine bacterium AO1-C]|nr:hypothetical protein BKI52_28800 [marine bacterium AO1-C]